MSQLRCPKCGAPVRAEHGKQYVTCDSCQTVIYIDRSSVIFNYIMPFILDEEKARAVFRRWCAGPSLAKDLEQTAEITSVEKIYFPVFLFRRTIKGQEKSIIKPAKGTTLPGLQSQIIPPGDVKVFDSSISTKGAEIITPEISVETYLADLPGTAKEQALLYLPFYVFHYRYQGVDYISVMGGTSGRVYTAGFPGRSAAPYALVVGGGFLLAFIGGILGFTITPIFYVLAFAGAALAMFTGRAVVKTPDGGAKQ
ncbi:hypothetical protein [Methanorbis furvi]|uniref:Zinc ribbon domain-containing protein n=1 Tax=Methanorbis furvi TaxID=3028299 RepID=A0AAE4MBR0_9EURY|nr:hypothetical protein [Methanocorpusculaceae archaeon Ag1]